ncbi:hypothetical protein NLJ89_g2411 [Agrocybe chaxingu]|uniref:Uncharacterized protein n=1 Tax=Agrocybe chaxingu TaxID=84603 RepID=A0A9W8K6N2_9AGAR|nr:hypothetical protein NLJ89_g2411 [Agrocybe chaxingu]
MSQQDDRSRGTLRLPRHSHATSLDTNASGIAESTISLGLSRFPEPPSSIPTTPLRTNPEGYFNSPSRSTFESIALPSLSPLRTTPHSARSPNPPGKPPPTFSRYNHIHSLNQSSNAPMPPHVSEPPQPSSSSHILAAYDWHDGESGVDVDATEDRLLPTSFITSLLQENKESRRARRNSYAASEAFSGISEMTYPPIERPPHNQRSEESRPPPSAYSQRNKLFNRASGDSETLHSTQGYSSRTGVHPPSGSGAAGLQSGSSASQVSSTMDSDTIRSMDKGFPQSKLGTTYELGDDPDYKSYSMDAYQAVLPLTTAARRRTQEYQPTHERRGSVHSAKSSAPTFMSRVSGFSLRRILPWKTVKPLPPVPIIPDISVATQNAHRRQEEAAPLPDLVNRAGALRDLLEKGQHPHQSISSFSAFRDSTTYDRISDSGTRKSEYPGSRQLTMTSQLQKSQGSSSHRLASNPRRRRICIVLMILVVLVLAAVGIGVGLTLGKKNSQPNCEGNLAGSICSLDATCVCTSSTTQCNGVAQSVLNILPVVNQLFKANLTAASTYSNLWLMQGSPTTMNCASQALLIDVGSGLDPATFPNRTQWAQAALLWNSVQTQDTASAQKMLQSVQSLPWQSISSSDGPVAEQASFDITSSGFTYNFASQTVVQPPASFITLGQPTNAQIARVSSGAQLTLDRMYAFAQASSIQRSSALKKYWTSVLLQRLEDLPTFKAVLSVSPIMLAFNASSNSLRNLYTTSPSSTFPPPLSCIPGLSTATQQQINVVETSVYDLPSAASASQFDSACFRERPIYGVLNVLRLRLPFLDARTGIPKQAALLTRDANPRVVVYNGELFSSSVTGATTISPSQLDPRQYGTLSFFDHVVLRYLSSIADVNVASALVKFVLDSASKTPVPPDSSSILFRSLQSLPALEVAVFGDVGPPDLTSTVSPFTDPSGSLFFGSSDGSALRSWTIDFVKGSIVWTENATSPLVVRDTSLGDNTITQTWNAINTAITNNIPNIGLPNITSTLTGTQDFSP